MFEMQKELALYIES